MRRNRATGLAFILLFSLPLCAQTVSRADLILESVGVLDPSGGTPVVTTGGFVSGRFIPVSSVRFEAGLLFGIPDSIRFFHADETVRTFGFAVFDGASLVLPDLLDSPLTGIAFTGRYDSPQSNTLMRENFKQGIEYPRFGSRALEEALSGSAEIAGTGLGLTGIPGNGPAALALFAHWNAKPYRDAVIGNDVQLALATESIRLNAFAGSRIRTSTADMKIRADLAASLGDPLGNEFFAQMGMFDATPGRTATDRVYLLFEPRLHRDHAFFAMAFFSAPVFEETETGDSYQGTYIGTAIQAAFGSIALDRARGGLSVSGALDPRDPGVTTPLSFSINPYFECALSDFLFESSLSINPFRLADPASAGELRLTLKAVY